MRAPYGLEIIESCCPTARMGFSATSLLQQCRGWQPSRRLFPIPRGTLFVEGQTARGVFILSQWSGKRSTTSADGKTLTVRIADQGADLVAGQDNRKCEVRGHAHA